MRNRATPTQLFSPSLPWAVPILLVFLFIAILILVPWQAQKLETNERQEQLIADTLWVEQTLSFQLKRNEENLSLIGDELLQEAPQSPAINNRLRVFANNNHEIQDLLLLNSQQVIVGAYLDTLSGKQDAIRNIRETNSELQSLPKTVALINAVEAWKNKGFCVVESNAKALLICRFPITSAHDTKGSIIVSYRLQSLLDESVPWWFAQENEISLFDADEKLLAKRAVGGLGKHVYTHNRALELPKLTLNLHTDSTKSEPKLLSNFLVSSVVVLSLGLVWSLIALWRDIHRRLLAEGALRHEVRFRAAMENSLITGLRARDMEGRLTYVNPAFCKMIGVAAEHLIGKLPPMPYWAPEARAEYEERFAQILTGTVQPEGFETIYQRANGERFPVLIYESPLVDESGKQTGWMSSILDISELQRAQELSRQHEEKLHANARLATMGEMASMLAHELNQPLAAISSYTTGAINLLQDDSGDKGSLQTALEKARQQAQRAGQIIHSVHEFVKKRDAERRPLQIADLLDSVMPLVELQAHHTHTQIQLDLAPNLPLVIADKVLLEQVLLNLTRNGIEAMEMTNEKQKQLTLRASLLEAERRVLIEVIDHGCGIDAQTQSQLFSPFFSTKESGMGMGLNICRTAIEFHGGTLQFKANPQGGTIFAFSLPYEHQ